jgi:hypothetical protein
MSDALALPGVTNAPPSWSASAVIGAGQAMVGRVVSTTVIVVEQWLVLPDWSIAVYVTLVVPSGKTPAGTPPETTTELPMSDAVALPGVTNAPPSWSASAMIDTGQVMVGRVVSTTVIVVEQLTDEPDASVAK